MAAQEIIIRNAALRQRAADLVANLDLSKTWRVTVVRYQKRRSLSQNALYWKWCNVVAAIVADDTGMDIDEVHAFFKAKFLPAKIIEIAGQTVEHRTTTKLTTAEMSDYMTRITAFCSSDLGLFLPTPEEVQQR